MKRIFTIAAALFLTASVWAQAPDKMSYQAVIRDAGNSFQLLTILLAIAILFLLNLCPDESLFFKIKRSALPLVSRTKLLVTKILIN